MDVTSIRHLRDNLMLIFVIFCGIHVAMVDGLSCYICSYTYTGVREASYNCVSEPWNVTTGLVKMPCQPNQMCMTKTVYTKGYKRLNSFDRYCGRPETFTCGTNCCDSSSQNEVCQYDCQADLCNNNTKVIAPLGSGKTGSGTGSVVINKFLFFVFFILIICAWLI